MAVEFEKIKVYGSKLGALKKRAAIAIPGVGIFVHPDDKTNIDLLRHEFGHILQRRKWGWWFFISKIAINSIISAKKSNKYKQYKHMNFWTEWTANKLAYDYFNCPGDWNYKDYPLEGEMPSKIYNEVKILSSEINVRY